MSAVITLLAISWTIPLALGCPIAQCDCQDTGMLTIYCKGKGLTEIPAITPSTTTYEELTLADNSITSIPANAFQGLRVKKIDLQKNPIMNISKEAFASMETMLETLVLHGNKENRVLPGPWPVLANLSSLTHLELSFFDMGTIDDSSALSTLTSLETLKITYSQLHFLHSDLLRPVSNTLTTLDLSHNGFLSVPSNALHGVTALRKLIMPSNSISRLERNGFSTNTRLRELVLAQNLISEMEPGCFNQITESLALLGLNLNRLSGTKLGALENMTALEQLLLGHNPLVTIPAGTFRNLGNMVFLNLRNTQLTSITVDMMEGLRSTMSLLVISENRLTQIETGAFARMTTLRELELDHQQINISQVIKPGVFSGLGSLEQLDLQNTGFGTAENWEAIGGLTSLTHLDLSSNRIEEIPDFVFKNLSRLKTLDLHGNLLTSINQETFHGLKDSLQGLRLQENSISSFNHCTFYNFIRLQPQEINLNSNPLLCDCGLEWLSEWLQRVLNESTPEDKFRNQFLQWTCNDGRKFIDIQPEDLGCDVNTTRRDCANYNITSTTTTTTTTATTTTTTTPKPTPPNLVVRFNITGVSSSTMDLEWNVNYPSYVDYYMIVYEDLSTSQRSNTEVIYRTTNEYKLRNLESERTYEACLFVYYKNFKSHSEIKCRSGTTSESTTAAPAQSLNSEQIGILAGSVAGGVLLLIIIMVIVFILIRHRKQGNVYDKPMDPAPWQRAGKPHEAYDSKRFTKQKKLPGQDHHIKEIRHVQGNTNLQRTSAGSYQYLDKDISQLPAPGGQMGLSNSFNQQRYPPNGLDTRDLQHKYYEIDLDGIETHI